MMDVKNKLINLISALKEENIINYCYTFIGLKVYGVAELPEIITEDLRKMHEKRTLEHHEQTTEEKKAEECRCNIVRTVYGVKNLSILNYINIIVSDIAKEDKKGGVSDE